MQMIPVDSTQIAELGHEGTTLRVRFNNMNIYIYDDVPEAVFQEIISAASVGKKFHELIKKNAHLYPYHKVG